MQHSTGAPLTLLLAAFLATAGCNDQSADPSAKDPTSSAAPAASSAPAAKAAAYRDGSWAVEAIGRGKAYDIASKGGVVTLNMGGTVFEGKDHPKGRRYTTPTSNYLLEKRGDGFSLAVDGKPTWVMSASGGDVTLSSDDAKLTIAKSGDAFEVKKGDELIGKVATEGDDVLVSDADGKTKYKGKDGLVAGWGLLLAKDVHPVARRIFLAELLARG